MTLDYSVTKDSITQYVEKKFKKDYHNPLKEEISKVISGLNSNNPVYDEISKVYKEANEINEELCNIVKEDFYNITNSDPERVSFQRHVVWNIRYIITSKVPDIDRKIDNIVSSRISDISSAFGIITRSNIGILYYDFSNFKHKINDPDMMNRSYISIDKFKLAKELSIMIYENIDLESYNKAVYTIKTIGSIINKENKPKVIIEKLKTLGVIDFNDFEEWSRERYPKESVKKNNEYKKKWLNEYIDEARELINNNESIFKDLLVGGSNNGN